MKKISIAALALLIPFFSSFARELNLTASPDSTLEAFTMGGNLFVREIGSGKLTQVTTDGSEAVLNGRASWVYYEEIFGRPSRYRAFWWSPDSKKLAFYRFDESAVSLFSIFSPAGQNGKLQNTRYPKAGQANPSVKIGIYGIGSPEIVWASFPEEDQYFGTPFWDAASEFLYVQREPRRQSTLELHRVDSRSGAGECIYSEHSDTWVEWIEGMLFGSDRFWFVRDTRTGWQQIYSLKYDGSGLEMLTEGENWDMTLLKEDEGRIWFLAKRGSRIHPSLYRWEKHRIYSLTPENFWASGVRLEGKKAFVRLSTAACPEENCVFNALSRKPELLEGRLPQPASGCPLASEIRIRHDGYDLYGLISYPKDFDAASGKKYPLIMEVYGGPGTAYVRDYWKSRDATNAWAWENGVIWMVVDPRSSGENGRRGLDEAFRKMTVTELGDYIAWAEYMGSLPYVDKTRIGVEGFSFGGTTTAMLVLRYPEYFRCGIAGGGVYDWHLYDSHYTERFMDLPEFNAAGYDGASVIWHLRQGDYSPAYRPYSLRLTHGTGDDNVHFQNTLQLIDELQKKNIKFELMIYPDGMHGYRAQQHRHDAAEAAEFWRKNLL